MNLEPAAPPMRAGGRDHRRGRTGPRMDYGEVAAHLREHPGQWFRLITTDGYTRLSHRIRSGEIPAFRPAGTFDAAQRRLDDDRIEVIATFLGDTATTSTETEWKT